MSSLRDQIHEALEDTDGGTLDDRMKVIMPIIDAALFAAENLNRDGRCRWCGRVVSEERRHPRDPIKGHEMRCRLYVGPLEHRWVNTRMNPTFGGTDYYCLCGGWFRRGGLAGHGDASQDAEPVCPNADQDWRGPREDPT